jgi:hypothetical protein
MLATKVFMLHIFKCSILASSYGISMNKGTIPVKRTLLFQVFIRVNSHSSTSMGNLTMYQGLMFLV